MRWKSQEVKRTVPSPPSYTPHTPISKILGYESFARGLERGPCKALENEPSAVHSSSTKTHSIRAAEGRRREAVGVMWIVLTVTTKSNRCELRLHISAVQYLS